MRPHPRASAAIAAAVLLLAVSSSALAAPSAQFDLSSSTPCEAGSCIATVTYQTDLLAGPVRVDVDWDHPSADALAGFTSDDSARCLPGADALYAGLGCVLRSPVYQTAGSRYVAVRVTDALGRSAAGAKRLDVAARPKVTSCRVPRLIGLTLARAKAKLAAAHCTLGTVRTQRKGAGPLVVRAQDPVAPATLPAGSPVDLTLVSQEIRPPIPPRGTVLQGVSGTTSVQPFAGQVGVKPDVVGIFVRWGSLGRYVFNSAAAAHAQLMIHISTSEYQGGGENITPRAIARGAGDGYLLRLNSRIAAWGKPTYVRLLAEMNQAHSTYAAFNRDGSSRGPSHSTAAFKQAWRRATLIIRGGPVATIDRRLKALHLPPLRGRGAKAVLPLPDVAMAWVPQTRGTPDIPANMPAAYWPGGKYVDWVGTDFYSRYPNFGWLSDFYKRFRSKPFVFGEWAMWGSDNAGFVSQLFGWVRSHPGVRMMLYNQGAEPHGPFRLEHFPRARSEIRSQLRRRR